MSIESYHIRLNNQNEGLELLKKADVQGFVFQESNGWVTLVVNNKELTPCESLINVNPNYMLYFIDADDNGCVFTLFNKSKVISNYSVLLDKDTMININNLNIENIYPLINEINDKYDKKGLLDQFSSIDRYDLYHETISEKIENIFKIENFNTGSFKDLFTKHKDKILDESIKYKK